MDMVNQKVMVTEISLSEARNFQHQYDGYVLMYLDGKCTALYAWYSAAWSQNRVTMEKGQII